MKEDRPASGRWTQGCPASPCRTAMRFSARGQPTVRRLQPDFGEVPPSTKPPEDCNPISATPSEREAAGGLQPDFGEVPSPHPELAVEVLYCWRFGKPEHCSTSE